jgi:hypothetical protein
VGSVVVVVAEVVDEVSLERGQLGYEGAGERGSPAFLEDCELEPFDVAVRGWSAGADPPLLDPELGEVACEFVGAKLGAVIGDQGLEPPAGCGEFGGDNGVIPNRASGYCVDDVARLSVVALELARRGDEQIWTSIVHRSLAFLQDATDPSAGMRNFMGYDRRWLDEPHRGDHVGRTVWALGEILSTAWVPAVVGPAARLLEAVTGTLHSGGSLRTGAYAALGLSRLDPDRLEPHARLLLEGSVGRLADAYQSCATENWKWFEDDLTYDNARLPHALISGGIALGREDLTATGLEALRWLGDESGLDRGTLRLTGHLGRRRDEPAPGLGDEQPLDASAFVEAELAAFSATGDPEHGLRAQRAFDWFLGRNRLERPLYDFATGGCSDGLGDEAANDNEGAESTLALHRAALVLDAAGLRAIPRRGGSRPVHEPEERDRAVTKRAVYQEPSRPNQ